MQLCALVHELEKIAPTHLAEAWDNVGLLVGDPAQDVSRAMLTIDYTAKVAVEARGLGCELIIAYHPPIFEPLKRITSGSLVFNAIRHGMAIYSPHTALDVAEGGTCDMLADVVGMSADRQPLKLISPKSDRCKLIVFAPENAVEQISGAMFDSGAGRIGNYSSCSFRTSGTGTFFGEEGTHPAVGQQGKLEQAAEIRIETIVPLSRIEAVIGAMRKAHPYEEPAFDLVPLIVAADGVGMGRIGVLPSPMDRIALVNRIKQELGLSHVMRAGPADGLVHRVAVCPGACGKLLDEAIAQKADLYLTGEMRHHDAIKAAQAGTTVICTLHSHSERKILSRLQDRLATIFSTVDFRLSNADCDPFTITE